MTGYIIHPSLFDGTIHAVCATMFDQDPPFLKIFAGVGKVTVVTKEVPELVEPGVLCSMATSGYYY